MKIKDIVFIIDPSYHQITKTRIVGTQDKLEKDDDGKDVIRTYYCIKISNDKWTKSEEYWLGANDIYSSLEKAQAAISAEIEREIIEAKTKISIIDVSGNNEK